MLSLYHAGNLECAEIVINYKSYYMYNNPLKIAYVPETIILL